MRDDPTDQTLTIRIRVVLGDGFVKIRIAGNPSVKILDEDCAFGETMEVHAIISGKSKSAIASSDT